MNCSPEAKLSSVNSSLILIWFSQIEKDVIAALAVVDVYLQQPVPNKVTVEIHPIHVSVLFVITVMPCVGGSSCGD